MGGEHRGRSSEEASREGCGFPDLFTPGPDLSVVRAVRTGQFHKANRRGWRESINF